MVRQRRTQSSSLIANTPYLNTLLTFEAEISTISQNNYHSINRSVPEGSGLVSRRRRRRGRTDPVGKFGTTSTRGALPAAHNGCPPSDHSSTAGTPSRPQLKSGGGGPERRSAAVPAAVAKDSSFSFVPSITTTPATPWRRAVAPPLEAAPRLRRRSTWRISSWRGRSPSRTPSSPSVCTPYARLPLVDARGPFWRWGTGRSWFSRRAPDGRIQGRGIVILWGF